MDCLVFFKNFEDIEKVGVFYKDYLTLKDFEKAKIDKKWDEQSKKFKIFLPSPNFIKEVIESEFAQKKKQKERFNKGCKFKVSCMCELYLVIRRRLYRHLSAFSIGLSEEVILANRTKTEDWIFDELIIDKLRDRFFLLWNNNGAQFVQELLRSFIEWISYRDKSVVDLGAYKLEVRSNKTQLIFIPNPNFSFIDRR